MMTTISARLGFLDLIRLVDLSKIGAAGEALDALLSIDVPLESVDGWKQRIVALHGLLKAGVAVTRDPRDDELIAKLDPIVKNETALNAAAYALMAMYRIFGYLAGSVATVSSDSLAVKAHADEVAASAGIDPEQGLKLLLLVFQLVWDLLGKRFLAKD